MDGVDVDDVVVSCAVDVDDVEVFDVDVVGVDC